MRVLLSTIGSRGDVQPMVALALHLRAQGHTAKICAPPTFENLVTGLGLQFEPVGHDLRQGPRFVPGGATATAAAQFETMRDAARGCDVIVGCAAMQIAAHSVAESYCIPYRYAAYTPVALPSEWHAPPSVIGRGAVPIDADHRVSWDEDAQRWNTIWLTPLNGQRAALGLRPVEDVRSHVFTNRPMLAADPMLAPWPAGSGGDVLQTGAWVSQDGRPLPHEVMAFLDAGPPPICFGFGSMTAARVSGSIAAGAARELGHRAIVLSGWADLAPPQDSPDCLAAGEVNHQLLFQRSAAVVHHGGAGTTTAAAVAGAVHVVVPHEYDQLYFGERVSELGVGAMHSADQPTVKSLAAALDAALSPGVVARARALATEMRSDGTAVAAGELLGAVS